MSGAGVMRIKKLKGNGIITVAARHNRRVIQAEMGATGSIDPTRSHLNETLMGPSTAADVGQLAKDLMAAAGVVKLKKNAVIGLELVFSLPPGHAVDDRAYFSACAKWAVGKMDAVILSVDIHRDEAAPHCHVLLLPLIKGKMNGSDMVGGKQKLTALQKDFHAAVVSKFGLSKAPARLSGTAKQAGAKAVLQHLRETGDNALQSAGWANIRAGIENDPGPWLLTFGIEIEAPAKRVKLFVDYVTSKGKGPAKEANPIGFVSLKKEQTLCSVGFAPKPAFVSSPPPARPPPHLLPPPEQIECEADPLDAVRVRDDDHDPTRYNPDTGDYFGLPQKRTRYQRQTADAWVATACADAARS